MLKEAVYLFTVKMDQLPAFLALHMIAVTVTAVLRADVFITCGRFLIDNIFVDQPVGSQTVKASVYGCLTDIYSLRPEMV